jgi:hypothetical protein
MSFTGSVTSFDMRRKQEPSRQDACKIVLQMRAAAKQNGLWNEVRKEYLYERRAGEPVYAAAYYAQYEWDL